jgi:nucleoside-diphosphate-sugar epimerase
LKDGSLSFDPKEHTFLVTGGAGFIGSHIVRRLVGAGARVRVLDNFSTGRRANLAEVADRIELIEGDIADAMAVRRAVEGAEYVLHLAALASVPESVENPDRNFEVNYLGMHNLLLAARDAQVQRLVFSSSAAVYGDHPAPHHEDLAPRSLSPYAAAKHNGEQLCGAFAHVYGLPTVCLRYFNVFGPGQNPRSGYAAAIPIFITALLEGVRPTIYGDGRQSRDFVHVANIVDANLLSCGTEAAIGGVFNVAAGGETDLLELLALLRELAGSAVEPNFAPPRVGDIRQSYADITRAVATLGFRPRVGLAEGLRETFAWYREHRTSF